MTSVNISRGNSEVALYLDKASQAKSQYFHQSASFSKQSAYEDLINVWEECKTDNWDGYNAFPVQKQTFKNTYSFIESLPLGYNLPSVGVEPDGHLTLEWYRHPRWTISISISPEGILYYAALFGNSDVRGSENFSGEISKNLFDLIQRVNIA
jgi:hypothetical protein